MITKERQAHIELSPKTQTERNAAALARLLAGNWEVGRHFTKPAPVRKAAK